MKLTCLYILIFTINIINLNSQEYYYGCKLNFNIGCNAIEKRLVFAAGIRLKLYPFTENGFGRFDYSGNIQVAFSFGSIGSNVRYKKIDDSKFIFYGHIKPVFEILYSPINLSYGSNKSTKYNNGVFVLNSNFINNPLQNQNSLLQVGTNYIYSTNTNINIAKINEHYWQQVGYLQARYENIQLGYYNDGPPFNWFSFGDGYDRNYTGGGYIKIVLKNRNNDAFQNFAWEFEKYTGYRPDLFEINNFLQFEHLLIGDKIEQKKFANKNTFALGLINLNSKSNIELLFDLRDIRRDVQDIIHSKISKNPLFTIQKTLHYTFGLRITNNYKSI